MFKEETVFILGAGASTSYGYPLGVDLIPDILANTEDNILIPIPDDNTTLFKNGPPYPFIWLDGDNFLLDENKAIGFNKDYSSLPADIYRLADGRDKRRIAIVKIEEIDIFKQLKEALKYCAPTSIDSFLRHNEEHREAGKIMIIYSFLKRESKNKFCNNRIDNWYPHFLNDLMSECESSPEMIENNKLNIITFNYDVSLDYFLKSRLPETGSFKKISPEIITQLYSDRIHHVYGSIWPGDMLDNYASLSHCNDAVLPSSCHVGIKIKNDGRISLNENNKANKLMAKSRDLKNQIKTMYDERKNNDAHKEGNNKYKVMLEKAKNIVIIGFGFDRDNLNQLGFPSEINALSSFLKGKTIKWLNYGESMRGLSKQFLQLQQDETVKQKNRVVIVESIAKNICNAYQNDFKISLFQASVD